MSKGLCAEVKAVLFLGMMEAVPKSERDSPPSLRDVSRRNLDHTRRVQVLLGNLAQPEQKLGIGALPIARESPEGMPGARILFADGDDEHGYRNAFLSPIITRN